jgi:hypothetical protein
MSAAISNPSYAPRRLLAPERTPPCRKIINRRIVDSLDRSGEGLF